MSMAGTVALTIGIALSTGAVTTAWFFEGLFAVAAVQVVFADVCGAANLFNLVRQRLSSATGQSGRLVRHG
jgi:preprotein translocase subunit SecF